MFAWWLFEVLLSSVIYLNLELLVEEEDLREVQGPDRQGVLEGGLPGELPAQGGKQTAYHQQEAFAVQPAFLYWKEASNLSCV